MYIGRYVKSLNHKTIKKHNTLQIFIGPRHNRNNKDITKYMTEKEIKKLNMLLKNSKLFIHSNYQTLLGNNSPRMINAVLKELKSGDLLGAQGVVVHLGKCKKNIIKNAITILDKHKGKTKLLLETSSGKGNEDAITFEELGDILRQIKKKIKNKEMIGICLDTCHIFSAGYDIRNRDSTLKVLAKFNKEIGFNNLRCIHFNDSSFEFNSRTDCHNNIGCGFIGSQKLGGSLEGFKVILLYAKKYKIPVILETPNKKECYPINNTEKHELELETVKKLIKDDLKSIKLGYC